MDVKKSEMAESLKYEIKELTGHCDARGMLVEMLRADKLSAGLEIKQIYVASINPGNVRGNHYHLKRVEWFYVIGAGAMIYLKDIDTGITKTVNLPPNKLRRVTIYPKTAHALINAGEETIYLVSAQNNLYALHDPDTFVCQVVDIVAKRAGVARI